MFFKPYMSFKNPEDVPKRCYYCNFRHFPEVCEGDEDDGLDRDCQHFSLGRCFLCSIPWNSDCCSDVFDFYGCEHFDGKNNAGFDYFEYENLNKKGE